MSWLFNPPEPHCEPVRAGPLGDGEGDEAPAVPPFYELIVEAVANPVYGTLWPEAHGRHILRRGDTSFFVSGEDPIPLWTTPRLGRHTSPYIPHWTLAFGETHPGGAGGFSSPGVPIHSWSLYFGPVRPGPTDYYPIWHDIKFRSLHNGFDPLGENTFRSKRFPPGEFSGSADSSPEIFLELPVPLTIRPWWP